MYFNVRVLIYILWFGSDFIVSWYVLLFDMGVVIFFNTGLPHYIIDIQPRYITTYNNNTCFNIEHSINVVTMPCRIP